MKKTLLTLTLILTSLIVNAQVVDVIPALSTAGTDAIVVGDDIYVADIVTQNIRRINLNTSSPVVNQSFPIDDVITFIIEGSTAYYIDLFGGINSVDASDFSSNFQSLGTSASVCTDMVLIGDYLYFSELNLDSISRVNINNPGTVELVVNGINTPQGLALIGDYLYIANSGGDTIDRIDITSANPTVEVVATGFNNPGALIASGNMLYISEPGLSNGRVLSLDVSVANSTPTVLATNLANPIGIAIYGSDLYFVQIGNGTLSRLENILSVEENDITNNNIVVSPNPTTNGVITLSSEGNIRLQNIVIYDLMGREIFQKEYNEYMEGNVVIDLSLQSGTYIINIETNNGVATKKIIIN